MGGVVVLHPHQYYFSNHHDNLSSTPNFTVSDSRRRQTPQKKIVRKKGRSTEVVDPEMKNKATEFFAGFGFVDSPSPSSVPLPGFFTKNSVPAAARVDPTADLRRILGLSLA